MQYNDSALLVPWFRALEPAPNRRVLWIVQSTLHWVGACGCLIIVLSIASDRARKRYETLIMTLHGECLAFALLSACESTINAVANMDHYALNWTACQTFAYLRTNLMIAQWILLCIVAHVELRKTVFAQPSCNTITHESCCKICRPTTNTVTSLPPPTTALTRSKRHACKPARVRALCILCTTVVLFGGSFLFWDASSIVISPTGIHCSPATRPSLLLVGWIVPLYVVALVFVTHRNAKLVWNVHTTFQDASTSRWSPRQSDRTSNDSKSTTSGRTNNARTLRSQVSAKASQVGRRVCTHATGLLLGWGPWLLWPFISNWSGTALQVVDLVANVLVALHTCLVVCTYGCAPTGQRRQQLRLCTCRPSRDKEEQDETKVVVPQTPSSRVAYETPSHSPIRTKNHSPPPRRYVTSPSPTPLRPMSQQQQQQQGLLSHFGSPQSPQQNTNPNGSHVESTMLCTNSLSTHVSVTTTTSMTFGPLSPPKTKPHIPPLPFVQMTLTHPHEQKTQDQRMESQRILLPPITPVVVIVGTCSNSTD